MRQVQNTVLPIAICGASPALGSLASAPLAKPLVAPVSLTILLAGCCGLLLWLRSLAVSLGWPWAGLPTTLPMFLYSGVPGALPHLPSSVVCTGLSRFSDTPLAVQSMEAPAARVVAGQVTATPWSSVTRTLFKVTLPVLVTR